MVFVVYRLLRWCLRMLLLVDYCVGVLIVVNSVGLHDSLVCMPGFWVICMDVCLCCVLLLGFVGGAC